MKKIDLGQSFAILANLGVIVGIFLLVFELNQDRDLTTAQNRANIANGVTEFLVHVGSNPELTSLWRRGTTGERLEPVEQAQFFYLMTAYLRNLENVHYQYRVGLYDESEFRAQREQWRRLFSRPGYSFYLCNSNVTVSFSVEFAREIETLTTCPEVTEQ